MYVCLCVVNLCFSTHVLIILRGTFIRCFILKMNLGKKSNLGTRFELVRSMLREEKKGPLRNTKNFEVLRILHLEVEVPPCKIR